MTGKEIALATLMRQDVTEACINYCWITNSSYMSKVAGRDYWADSEGVFFDYLWGCGINLVPQFYMPGDQHRRLEEGVIMHQPEPGGWEKVESPEDVVRTIDKLPDDATVERDFNIEETARQYAQQLLDWIKKGRDRILFISHFGQADFMGGYNRWGYENYLMTIAEYPEAMRRYYHHTALEGRLFNQAVALACRKYGIAPFVYSGQDICGRKGPMASPAVLRQIYFPELKWCLEPLVENDVRVIWHCDGNIMPILDDLVALGVDGFQGFEEEHGVDYGQIVKLRNTRGEPVAVWGCVSVTSTFPHGTVADVRNAVERSFKLAGKGRGFVLSSTSSIMPEVPHENLDAFFQHGQAFGREFLGG